MHGLAQLKNGGPIVIARPSGPRFTLMARSTHIMCTNSRSFPLRTTLRSVEREQRPLSSQTHALQLPWTIMRYVYMYIHIWFCSTAEGVCDHLSFYEYAVCYVYKTSVRMSRFVNSSWLSLMQVRCKFDASLMQV